MDGILPWGRMPFHGQSVPPAARSVPSPKHSVPAGKLEEIPQRTGIRALLRIVGGRHRRCEESRERFDDPNLEPTPEEEPVLDRTLHRRTAHPAIALFIALAALSTAPLLAGDDCRGITSAPVTITEPGHYCLKADLVVDMDSSSSAIDIQTDHVVLDFQGHTLRNVARQPFSSVPVGVFAHERSHIVVRNGTVAGFWEGISLSEPFYASTSVNHLVEDMRVYDCQRIGIGVGGHFSVVQGNVVENITGADETHPTGLWLQGYGHRAIDNEVSRVNGDEEASRWGIRFLAGQDSVALGNRLVATNNGILMEDTGTAYRDNFVLQIPAGGTAFSGGVDVGGNVSY